MTETVERTCYRHPDRVTGLSCSECGRPICTECMTMAPVGIRCPEHSGKPQGVQRMTSGVKRAAYEGVGYVTRALIALNVGIYVLELAQGSGVNGNSGSIFTNGALIASGTELQGHLIPVELPFGTPVGVAHGDWWRLITSAFLHYGPFHLLTNMVALYWFGTLLERRIGAARFLALYLVSGLAGSAGALLATPNAATVGASGAIFGVLGAGLVMERQRDFVFGGAAAGMIVLNLVITFSFAFSGPVRISYGGHLGGLVGGALVMLGLTRFGRGHAAYGRAGLLGAATIVAVGLASVVLAYWRAKGYA